MDKIAIDLGTTFFGGSHPLQQPQGVASLVYVAASYGITLAGVVLIVMIIYSGYQMITASGDTQQFTRARGVLTSSIIGFIIVVGAWFIVRALEYSTKSNLL